MNWFEAYRHDVPLAQCRSAWMSSRRSRDHTCAPLSRPPCRSCAVCEARLHGFPSLPPSALQMVQRWQAATLTASLSLSAPLSRDDLFRVELDSVAGDEMFYSKVSRSQLDTAWRGCTAEFPLGPFGEMRIVSESFVFFFYRREHGSRTRTISGSAG